MKELLYLKDRQLKEFIEKIFIGYRECFSDAKKTLDNYSIGIAHHKVLHMISLHEGLTISDLLKKLKVTKQSLNRVLKDLNKLGAIKYKKNEIDTRLKHTFLTAKGEEICNEIFTIQKKRIYKAFISSSSEEVVNFDNVLKKIING